MKFTVTETALLLYYIKNKIQNCNSDIQTAPFLLLQTKLEAQEYIKGRLLKILYTEINEVLSQHPDNEDELKALAHKIKFKATPR